MKLNETTVNVLKNFGSINQNIVLPLGSEVKTVNDEETVFALATIPDEFPTECGIYDLNEFLSITQLVGGQDGSSVDLEFDTNYVTIKNKSLTSRYFYASKKLLKYPQRNIKMPEPFVTFEVKGSDLSKLKQAAGIFSHPNLAFYNKGGTILAKVFDPKTEDESSDFELVVGEIDTETEVSFKYVFNIQNLKYLIDTDMFEVSFVSKGKGKMAKFESLTPSISYFIGANELSTFQLPNNEE